MKISPINKLLMISIIILLYNIGFRKKKPVDNGDGSTTVVGENLGRKDTKS